jgi:hypothetical protein
MLTKLLHSTTSGNVVEISLRYKCKSIEEVKAKEAEIKTIADKYGAEKIASGAGFGGRDVDYVVSDDKADAMMFELQDLDFVMAVSKFVEWQRKDQDEDECGF